MTRLIEECASQIVGASVLMLAALALFGVSCSPDSNSEPDPFMTEQAALTVLDEYVPLGASLQKIAWVLDSDRFIVTFASGGVETTYQMLINGLIQRKDPQCYGIFYGEICNWEEVGRFLIPQAGLSSR